jgi:hypothetical protein
MQFLQISTRNTLKNPIVSDSDMHIFTLPPPRICVCVCVCVWTSGNMFLVQDFVKITELV